jgi:oligosaccharyltransferase complex subunit delta (ribophorin II)
MAKQRSTWWVQGVQGCSVWCDGDANCDQTQKDLPAQFLKSSQPIDASLVIGSFGQSKGYNDKAFSLSIARDPNVPIASSEKPLRYGKLPEIHHIFKPDPKSPNILITLIFTGAVLATVPMLLGTVCPLFFHYSGHR